VNFSQFKAVTHILKVYNAEITGDRRKQSVYEIVSIKRIA